MLLGSLVIACTPHACTCMCVFTLALHSCLRRGIGLLPEMGLWLYQSQIPSLVSHVCWSGAALGWEWRGEEHA